MDTEFLFTSSCQVRSILVAGKERRTERFPHHVLRYTVRVNVVHVAASSKSDVDDHEPNSERIDTKHQAPRRNA